MKFSTLTALAIASSLVSAAPALEPRGSSSSRSKLYARAEVSSDVTGIEARFEFWGRLDGTGTFVKVEVLKGLFAESDIFQGPFAYHVHTNPVGQERNCTKALAHLDPLQVTESLICDPAFPQYCQEGDLSGKHGKLNGTSSGVVETFGYTDDYLRWFPEDFSILGRSVVIHSSNKTRIACGDIISTYDGTANHKFLPTYKPSKFVKNYPTVAPTNPPQVVIPFVGETFPSDEVLHNLPFALANPAISLKDSLNVELTVEDTKVFINGTETTVQLPTEKKSDANPPFKGYTDKWSWD
ncbi:hypothetical protein FRB99_008909 [Tulasnella sp. 403]|nr:hypothetical protein FRB99_008909 [Tulasnella sp. 403]